MYSLLGPALFASLVAAHGHITNIVINGVSFNGWDINSYPYTESPPAVVAWGTPNTGNGFIAPDAYTTSDIICHLNATNAKGHAVVAAGDRVFLQWTDWPESHHGPVVDYLASCGSTGCETVDKTTLKFFKIDGVGLVDDTTVPGTWGDDQLVAQDSGWMVEIPPDIAPGHYVLRHELIALHSAGTEGGAQNYPQCFNLQITGSGSKQPAGVLGTDLYRPTDPGILVNIYTSLSTYVRDQSSGFADTSPGSTPLLMSLYQIVPGPTLYSGAVSVTQTTSASTASGTPVTGTGAATGGTTTTSTSKAITTTLVTTTRTTSPTTTTSKITTIRKLTTTTPSTTAAGGGGATQTLYGRCGGTGWTGATACASPAACSSSNPWYSHCVPIAA